MDSAITLRNKVTEQECTFDNEAAAHDFGSNITDPQNWEQVGIAPPIAGKVIEVDLSALRAAVAADTAAGEQAVDTAAA